jgi:hypothetical protein
VARRLPGRSITAKLATQANQGAIGNAAARRARISELAPDIYSTLQNNKQKKVSLSWVIRDAAEKYIADHLHRFG